MTNETINQNHQKNNDDHFDVRIWGPKAWDFMHTVTFAYPENNPSDLDKQNIIQFFQSIANNLPCKQCKFHFSKLLEEYPIPAENRETLSKWLVDRHNDVNKRLGKPIYPYEFVIKKYQDMSNLCPTTLSSSSSSSSSASCLEECQQQENKKENKPFGESISFLSSLFSSSKNLNDDDADIITFSEEEKKKQKNNQKKKNQIMFTFIISTTILFLFLCIIGSIYCSRFCCNSSSSSLPSSSS